jgi:hypothetical protein
MYKIGKHFAPFLCVGMALAGGVLHAQTIAITPGGYITTGAGGTLQLSATIKGDSVMNDMAIWSAGGVVGGNASVGTISSTGLYTAPMTLPASGNVQINAALMSNSKISAVTYIYLLPAGPTITSVSPNPIPVGTDTITLTGTNFKKGGVIFVGGVQYGATFVSSTSVKTSIYQGSATSTTVYALNSGSVASNTLVVSVAGTAPAGGSGGGSGSAGSAPVIAPNKITLSLGGTQSFTAAGATSWLAVAGTVDANGKYTAPAVIPASGTDTVTAKNATGQSVATITLVSNVAPTITSLATSPLPLGVFSTTVTGAGFAPQATAALGGVPLSVVYGNANTLTVSGFAGPATSENLVVSNGPVASQPFVVPVGVQNPQVAASAARRFLEQAAFGPTAADAAHVQNRRTAGHARDFELQQHFLQSGRAPHCVPCQCRHQS